MRITPTTRSSPLDLKERGKPVNAYAEAYVAALPLDIAQRELAAIGKRLQLSHEQLLVRGLSNDQGPGNALTITLEHGNVTEVFTGFGERGLRAETVAENAAMEAQEYIASSAPVGEHLADQLLLPLAIGAGGFFVTTRVTDHLTSNALVIERFTDRKVSLNAAENGVGVEVR
jgi:RNA 3'-terminal phosphate cyclase (ATP)